MLVFETILALLLGATVLSAIARRIEIPYPTLLALGGALIAFIPGAPRLELPPELILTLFVAPVLLDAAYDASFRDLKAAWLPVLSLVLVAVAVALGAMVAPPDAVAALAVLRHIDPPHRIRMVLEGESLLNDASALLIYKLAVGAVAAGGFNAVGAAPTFALVVLGSVVVGWGAALPTGRLVERIHDAPSSVVFQFGITFGVWLLAERLGLSGVVTIVVFGLGLSRMSAPPMPARLRVPSFAIWETATVVLNVLAFTLIGLQIGPILGPLSGEQRLRYLGGALAILAVVIGIRIAWVMTHHLLAQLANRLRGARSDAAADTTKGAVVIAWSGMRGVVTLAAAMALPDGFPYRDFIRIAAFVVVLGTLVLQGATLRPLMQLLRVPKDTKVRSELNRAREAALTAGLAALEKDETPAAQRLRLEYAEALRFARRGTDPREAPDNALRRRVVGAARAAIQDLRGAGSIGDDAYRRAEEELDWLELSAQPGEAAPGEGG